MAVGRPASLAMTNASMMTCLTMAKIPTGGASALHGRESIAFDQAFCDEDHSERTTLLRQNERRYTAFSQTCAGSSVKRQARRGPAMTLR